MCTNLEKAPGMFEGEPCFTKWAYDLVMDGMGEIDTPYGVLLKGPFGMSDTTPDDTLCQECIQDILNARKILVHEDSQGFVHAWIGRSSSSRKI